MMSFAFFTFIAALQNGESGQKVATGVSNASTAMNHLLLGKKPLVATKPRRAPHPGAIPSPKNKRVSKNNGGDTNNSHLRNTSATHYACPQVRLQFVPFITLCGNYRNLLAYILHDKPVHLLYLLLHCNNCSCSYFHEILFIQRSKFLIFNAVLLCTNRYQLQACCINYFRLRCKSLRKSIFEKIMS